MCKLMVIVGLKVLFEEKGKCGGVGLIEWC